ncbi:hypothetical protein K7J14_08445 [Treponema zuelzerae]|uniref:Uncharacterized protein n=1 Tax=Teretinema zuelzerae TaxID=156 RepID=A0AAE3JLE0_9SPIR|nr:hypothetical protein [Teretinema zuelzerae]MCD1654734.1 hypothetical protein [Teretinema zuelzerae]
MKAKDEALMNLVKVLSDAGYSVIEIDTAPEPYTQFRAERSGDDISLFGTISLLIEAQ